MTPEEIKAMKEQLSLLTEENEKLKNKEETELPTKKDETDKEDEVENPEIKDSDNENDTVDTVDAKDTTDDTKDVDTKEDEDVDSKKEDTKENSNQANITTGMITAESIAMPIISIEEAEFIKNQNKSLNEDLECLQEQLKGVYINSILDLKEFKTEDTKESYKTKLESRSLNSVKDLLEDLKEESLLDTKTKEEDTKDTKRTVVQVTNPLEKESKKEMTLEEKQNEKISNLVGMLTVSKK